MKRLVRTLAVFAALGLEHATAQTARAQPDSQTTSVSAPDSQALRAPVGASTVRMAPDAVSGDERMPAIAGPRLAGADVGPLVRWRATDASVPGAATQTRSAGSSNERRWQISFLAGTTSSGPADDFETAMRAAQLDESRGGCFIGLCFPGVDHPFSNTGFGATGFPWMVSGQGWLTSWYGIGLSGGVSAIGLTTGQRRDTVVTLEVGYTVTTVSPLFIVRPWRGMYTGIGPSFSSSKFETPVSSSDANQTDRENGVGVVWELGVAVPPRSPVFAIVLVQYRHTGDVTAGPFTRHDAFTGADATLPSSSVNMDHWFAGVGIGMRF